MKLSERLKLYTTSQIPVHQDMDELIREVESLENMGERYREWALGQSKLANKFAKALNYFASPEVYSEFELKGGELDGQRMMTPVLLNGLTIAQDALKEEK